MFIGGAQTWVLEHQVGVVTRPSSFFCTGWFPADFTCHLRSLHHHVWEISQPFSDGQGISGSVTHTTGPTTLFFTPRSQGAFQVDSFPVVQQWSCCVSDGLCLLHSGINCRHLNILIQAEKQTGSFWEHWVPMDLQSSQGKMQSQFAIEIFGLVILFVA